MCDADRTRFFRPWNCEEESAEEIVPSAFKPVITTVIAEPERKVKIEEEEDDSLSVASSSSCSQNYNSENESRRSYSVSSDEMNSLSMLSNFVEGKNEDERISPRNLTADDRCYTSAAAAAEWSSTVAPSAFYPPVVGYQCSSIPANWQLANHYVNSAAPLTTEYTWLPANYQTVQEAVSRINHQDAVAKQIKKLRPKKFRCNYCNVAFSNNGQLKGHLRIHTGERPFKCDAEGCGKSFTRNEELTRHKRIHTGLRPFSCLICRKGFGRKDHLKKHTKTHDNRNVYQLAAAAIAAPFAGYAFAHHPTMSAALPYVYQI